MYSLLEWVELRQPGVGFGKVVLIWSVRLSVVWREGHP